MICGATIVAALKNTALRKKGGGVENDSEERLVHFGDWWFART